MISCVNKQLYSIKLNSRPIFAKSLLKRGPNLQVGHGRWCPVVYGQSPPIPLATTLGTLYT